MQLSEEQIEHYYREGYVLARGLVPRTVVDEVMRTARGRAREGDFWQPTIYDPTDPHKDAAIHRLLWEPSVYQAASELLFSPARIYYGMLAVVPAGGGRGLPWHQDNQYSQILAGALNVFIALCDITPDMATLWVAPKSHLRGTLPSHQAQTHHGHREVDVEPDNGLQLSSLAPGDTCIFTRDTLHRSLTNTTDRPRFAYAAQYQADFARRATDGKRDPSRRRACDLHAEMSGATMPT